MSGDVRGGHVLDGVRTVLAREGFGALSVRSVASAAGVSPAQVQYYFRTRAELVSAAFERASEEFLAGLAAHGSAEPSLDRLRMLLWQWLPLDGDRADRARVWLAYAASAATDDRLAAAAAQLDADLRGWFTTEFESLTGTGQVNSAVPAPIRAAQVLALLDGLTVQALTLPLDQRLTLAAQTLDPWLAQLAPEHEPCSTR
ncbi:MAG: TetR/AcrR family transcriptional regulator [Nocardioidaceae bacterium]